MTDDEMRQESQDKLATDYLPIHCCSICNEPLMENEDEICEDCIDKMETKSQILEVLRGMLKVQPKERRGLCAIWEETIFAKGYTLLAFQQLLTRCNIDMWEHYSGLLPYPIPATVRNISIVGQYHRSGLGRWLGKQRELRLSLIRFLIAQVEENF